MSFSPSEILEILRPNSIADFIIYTIMLLSLIQTFVTPSGNDISNYMQFGTILVCILDLLRNGANLPVEGLDNDGFATFILRTLMFMLPLLIAGNLKSGKGKKQTAGPARALAILTFLIGLTYWAAALVVSLFDIAIPLY